MATFSERNKLAYTSSPFTLIINVLFVLMLTTEVVRGLPGRRIDGDHKRNPSRDDLYERKEIGFFPDDSLRAGDNGTNEDDDDDLTRQSRALPIHKLTGRVTMLFTDLDLQIDEKLEDFTYPTHRGFPFKIGPNDTTTTDFIVRLQEKYEYQICERYLKHIPQGTYFRYETELVYPDDGSPSYQAGKRERQKATFKDRYRLHGEACNYKMEWEFWQEMFNVSEEDSYKKLKPGSGYDPDDPDIPPEAYEYSTIREEEMVQRWNEVWEKYKNKGVCNQQLLLECLPVWNLTADPIKPTGAFSCSCRRNLVGLSSLFNVRKIPPMDDSYTTQYYYDNVTLMINGEEVVNSDNVKLSLKCAMVASVPFIGVDINLINPCDFFLPMIGMCRTDCVANATCMSVDQQHIQQSSSMEDLIKRVKHEKLHEHFYNKCICTKGKLCRNDDEVVYDAGERLRMSFGGKLILLLLTSLTSQLIVP